MVECLLESTGVEEGLPQIVTAVRVAVRIR